MARRAAFAHTQIAAPCAAVSRRQSRGRNLSDLRYFTVNPLVISHLYTDGMAAMPRKFRTSARFLCDCTMPVQKPMQNLRNIQYL
jgi:hypothetical protein